MAMRVCVWRGGEVCGCSAFVWLYVLGLGVFVMWVAVVGAVGVVICGFVGFRRELWEGRGDVVEEEMESWFDAFLHCPVSCVKHTMPCRVGGAEISQESRVGI